MDKYIAYAIIGSTFCTVYGRVPDHRCVVISIEYERMSMADAREWAAAATEGEYLVEYEDTGMTAEEDLGSRCGFDDRELAELGRILRRRGLCLDADDIGLAVKEVFS